MYRGIPLIVSSTFQGETDFMQMLGYKPKMGYLRLQYSEPSNESFAFKDPFGHLYELQMWPQH